MAVTENNIIRGGKGFTVTEGVNPDGKSRCIIQDVEPHPVHNQPIKRAPVKLEIIFDEGNLEGEVYKIITTWKTALLSNGNIPLQSEATFQTMTSSSSDMDEFVAKFFPALMYMINGYVRAELGGNKTGWNDMPVYGAQGQLLDYTEEQENKPADNYYYNPPALEPTE